MGSLPLIEKSRTLLGLIEELHTFVNDSFNFRNENEVLAETMKKLFLSRCKEIQGTLEHINYDNQKELVAVGLAGAELTIKWAVYDKIKGNKRKQYDFFRSVLKSLASISIPGAAAVCELFDTVSISKKNPVDAK